MRGLTLRGQSGSSPADRVGGPVTGSCGSRTFDLILRDSALVFLSKLAIVASGFLANLVIARCYGAAVTGTVALVMTYLNFSGFLAGCGVTTLLLRLVPELKATASPGHARAATLKAARLVFYSSCLFAGLAALNADGLAAVFAGGQELTVWLAFASGAMVLYNLGQLNIAILRAYEQLRWFAAAQLLQPLTYLAVLLVMAGDGRGENVPLLALMFSIAVSLVATTGLSCRMLSDVSGAPAVGSAAPPPGYRALLIASWPMFLTGAVNLVIAQSGVIALGAMTEASTVGIYSVVMKLGMMASFLLTSVNMVLAPRFSALFYANDLRGLAETAMRSSRVTFMLTAPVLLLLILLGKPLLALFGQAFSQGYPALVIIALGQLINTAAGAVGHFMNMTGHQRALTRIMVVAVVVNVALNIVLIPAGGLNGAAWASLVTTAFWNCAAALYIRRQFGFYIGYVPCRALASV